MALISSILLSCASADQQPGDDQYVADSRGSRCISQTSIRDYRVLDDANLIIEASPKRKYHVSLYRPVFGLRSTWQIGFSDRIGMICAGSGDMIVDGGLGPESIRIASIRKLTPEDEEDLLIRYGLIESPTEQTPPPADVEGAEVEELD